MLKCAAFPLVALWLAHEAEAWWDAGHFLAACVARHTLIESGRQDVVDAANKLMALYDENGVTNDMCRAATWMDWIKVYSSDDPARERLDALTAFSSQHYIDFLTTSAHLGPVQKDIDDLLDNVTYIHMDNLLSNAMFLVPPASGQRPENYGTVYTHNLWMRWLLHLMGDAHNPLHMTAMYVYEPDNECNGEKVPVDSNDAGGNGIGVTLNDDVDEDLKNANPTTLHGLWDSMGGYGNRYADAIDDEEMFAWAAELVENYSAVNATEDGFTLKNFTLKEVYTTSAFLAATAQAPWDHKFAYEEIAIPEYYCPSEYTPAQKTACCKDWAVTREHGRWVKETTKKLVAIAGYRIADVLERWYDGLSTRLEKDLQNEYKRQTAGASGLVVGSAAVALAAGALLY